MQVSITNVKGYEFIDSRGNPTVGAEVTLSDGCKAMAMSPSGASTGMYEAHELRDQQQDRYGGKGVLKAVQNIDNVISSALCNLGTTDQTVVDDTMITLDGTENKSKLGANAILAVSLAVARASAKSLKMPLYRYIGGISNAKLPIPMMNILNGGAHSTNNIDIQEFMIMPVAAESFAEGLRQGIEIYHSLGSILKQEGLSTGVGDEGGFAPNLTSDDQAIEYILKAIEKSGFTTSEVKIALDVASSEWYEDGRYKLPKRGEILESIQLIDHLGNLVNKYPIMSIEDGLGEQDWEGWKLLTERLGNKVLLVGDDLFVTNTEKLQKGIDSCVANSILVKLNQIGTLTETLDVINLAKDSGYTPIISHRSGETEDTFIADLVVGTGAGFLKSGAPCRTDRVCKYNRLLKIENDLYY